MTDVQTDDEGNIPIAIIGSRNWPDAQLHEIDDYVDRLPKNVRVISGKGGKVDLRAAAAARRRGLRLTEHPVDLTDLPTDPAKRRFEFTARAYERDRRIAADCFYMVAFWNPYLRPGVLNKRGGTRYTVKRARELGKPCLIFLPIGTDPRKHRI